VPCLLAQFNRKIPIGWKKFSCALNCKTPLSFDAVSGLTRNKLQSFDAIVDYCFSLRKCVTSRNEVSLGDHLYQDVSETLIDILIMNLLRVFTQNINRLEYSGKLTTLLKYLRKFRFTF
jgi:hypothetical protein